MGGGFPRWDSRVQLVEEEGGGTGLPEEGFQEAPKGFGLSKWKKGCHSPSSQPPVALSRKGRLWQVPGMEGKQDPDFHSRVPSTSRTLREAKCGGGVAESEGTVPGGKGSLPRKRVPGCQPARPATHVARRW